MNQEPKIEIEVPKYFLCPISLQIMQDPVTTTTGITYDRATISRWLSTAEQPLCPVTKQPLQGGAVLTPNHTLRRLIQAWCISNTKHGVEKIPTPKSPLTKSHVIKIIRDLTVPHLQPTSLDRLLDISSSHENKKLLVDPTVVKGLTSFIVRCYKNNQITGVEPAMKILARIWKISRENIVDDFEFINAITWVLNQPGYSLRNVAVLLTKELVKIPSSSILERLKPEFYHAMVKIIKQRDGKGPVKGAIRVLLEICQHGRNRQRIIEAGAIFELIELELEMGLGQNQERKKISELGMSLMAQLCSCADGRAQFLAHSGSIAVVSKRILRVSTMVDDRVVQIFSLICKFSGTKEVLHEMLRVGAVSKLCMVLQADCAKYLKDKVSEILRMHSCVWNNSPCIQLYLLTRYPMLQF